jgi:carboxymethylenebutenolidase
VPSIGRRAIATLMVACLQWAPTHAQAAQHSQQDVIFVVDGKPATVAGYLPEAQQDRPAVILLHGRGGFDAFTDGFDRYARALANAGMEAYLFPYYDYVDAGIMNSTDRQKRQSHFRDQIDKWSNRVDQVAAGLLARKNPASSVGLIGFSNGGFVAVAAAGKSKRFAALVVMYGGLPDWLPNVINSLPTTLVMHGEADRIIPIAEGEKLRAFAARLGTRTEFVRIPGADHGFDLGKDNGPSVDARHRVIAFLTAALKKP